MNWLFFGLINLVVVVGLVVYVNRRIDKRLRPDEIIGQMRSEIEGIITELNQTTERNIELIEDRVKRVQSLLDAADRRISILKRESDKEDRTKEIHESLSRIAAQQRLHATPPNNPRSQPAATSHHEQESRYVEPSHGNAADRRSDADTPEESSGGNRSGEGAAAAAAPGWSQESNEASRRSRREQILDLHRKGIAANIIANRVGTTIGEVELVISLDSQ
jgi:hypothetical protein